MGETLTEKLPVHEIIMQFAYLAASNSVGPNGKIGACITNFDDKIISLGWNGVPKGSEEYADSPKHAVLAVPYAILNVGSERVKACTIYVTEAPTHECAKVIVLAGIKRVIYVPKEQETSKMDVIKKIFEGSNVELWKFSPSEVTKDLVNYPKQ